MKRALYAAATALCLLLLLSLITCAAVTHMGRDGALYARCFHSYARTAHMGVDADQYDGIARDVARFLSGQKVNMPYFNGREMQHLADIRALFALFDKAWWLLIAGTALAVPLLRRPDGKGFLIGCGLAALLLFALAAYIALDFEGAFILMHRLLFTNDLWLLDPNTDLLICLMPEPMFIYLAKRLAWTVIPLWLLIPTVAILARQLPRGRSRRA